MIWALIKCIRKQEAAIRKQYQTLIGCDILNVVDSHLVYSVFVDMVHLEHTCICVCFLH